MVERKEKDPDARAREEDRRGIRIKVADRTMGDGPK
jgi:hypothetical protein